MKVFLIMKNDKIFYQYEFCYPYLLLYASEKKLLHKEFLQKAVEALFPSLSKKSSMVCFF